MKEVTATDLYRRGGELVQALRDGRMVGVVFWRRLVGVAVPVEVLRMLLAGDEGVLELLGEVLGDGDGEDE